MKATGSSLVLVTALAAVSSIVGTSHSVAQPPGVPMPVSATLFRDIARRENPVVVSIMTRRAVSPVSCSRPAEPQAEMGCS
jgi:hypothetical protein